MTVEGTCSSMPVCLTWWVPLLGMISRIKGIFFAGFSFVTAVEEVNNPDGNKKEKTLILNQYGKLSQKIKHLLDRKAAHCSSHPRTSGSPVKMAAAKPEVVMVIGGAGFLGQHVVKELQERGENIREIRVFDLKAYENKLGHAETKPISSTVGDLCKLSDVIEALEGVDSVIQTAGLISYGTFPDFEGMENVNVKGTSNVIQACIKQKVSRLVYTSTIDVVVGYDDIHDGDETLPIPRKLLFPGYPDTKYRGEQLVLKANGRPLGSGDGACLRTLALRPNVMYGALDPYFVPSALKSAKSHNGVLTKVGNGEALFQQAYVGNMAWAHVVANQALTRHDDVGGHVYFVTDDTPLMSTFEFMEPFLKARGFALSSYSIPYSMVYCILLAAETMCKLIKPLKKVELGTPLCSLIYVNKTFYFNRTRAESLLGYKPVYDYKESLSNSLKYYSTMEL